MNPSILIPLAAALATGLVVWLALRSRAETARGRLSDRDSELERTRGELEKERTTRAELDRALTAERAARSEEQKAMDEKIALLKATEERLAKEMDSLSRKALDSNAKSFLEMAKEQFDHLITKAGAVDKERRAEIEKLVQPIGKSLEEVQKHLKDVEKTRTEAYSSLVQQVKGMSEAQAQLQKEASNLVSALRKPQVRGQWGEVQLRRVVELAGMEAFCDFDEQFSVTTSEGRLRPDLIIRLPGDRIIVVDAKVPLEAYLDAVNTDDDAVRKIAMQRHVSQIRDHVKKLGAKAYFDQFPTTPDMAVMFLPGESFYYAALQEDPALLEYGVGNNVVIATPMTLIALLRAVSYGWRQEAMAENAMEIANLGRELYDRLSVLAEHFARVGSGLGSAVEHYNRAVGSFEGRVLVQARRLREMGSGSSREIQELGPVDKIPRTIDVPEYHAQRELTAGDGKDGGSGLPATDESPVDDSGEPSASRP